MRIAVIGTGYVGLVSGVCFAEMGNTVTGIDIDKAKIGTLQKGQSPIYEPQAEELLKRNLQEGRLRFTTNLGEGIKDAEVIFFALPTPASKTGAPDLSILLSAAEDLGKVLDHYAVIVNKSTVPVGTAAQVRERVARHSQSEFDVVSNPEFLREGLAVDDFMHPDRIVVGSSSRRATATMQALYEPLTLTGSPLLLMDEASAELTKYAANAFLATKISFINEVANVAERAGANIDLVRAGIGADERIGSRFLFPGIGFGGSCFPKDVSAFINTAAAYDYDFNLLKAVTKVNAAQKQLLVKKLTAFLGSLKGKRIAVWGLAFKPDTDDIREAPALDIIRELLAKGATVAATDPEAITNVQRVLSDPKLHFSADHYAALKDADALLIATEWPVFRRPDFAKMRAAMKQPVIFDGRNIYEPDELQAQGFYYASIGRQTVDGR